MPQRGELTERFEKAAEEWEMATMHLSGPGPRDHPAYLAIVAMGKPAIPHVLRRIVDGCPWKWYPILVEIMGGKHPRVPEKDRGRLEPVRKVYLDWARSHGYSPDHGVPPEQKGKGP